MQSSIRQITENSSTMFDKTMLFCFLLVLMIICLTEPDRKNCDHIYYKTSFHLKIILSSNHIQKERMWW